MSAVRAFAMVLIVAGCTATNNPSQTGASGSTKIQLTNGQNCWNNRCIRYSEANRSVSVIGKHPVRVPRDIDVRDGLVTEAEFAAMFQAANMAFSTGAGRR